MKTVSYTHLFLSDWSATTKRHIAGAEYYPAAERHTDDILQIVPSGPFGKWRALLQLSLIHI